MGAIESDLYDRLDNVSFQGKELPFNIGSIKNGFGVVIEENQVFFPLEFYSCMRSFFSATSETLEEILSNLYSNPTAVLTLLVSHFSSLSCEDVECAVKYLEQKLLDHKIVGADYFSKFENEHPARRYNPLLSVSPKKDKQN